MSPFSWIRRTTNKKQDEQTRLDKGQQHEQRLQNALQMLMNNVVSDRLNGIYRLETIARESKHHHPFAIEQLTAFIRDSKAPHHANDGALGQHEDQGLDELDFMDAKQDPISTEQSLEIELEQPALSSATATKIRVDIQAAITVIGRRNVEYDQSPLNLRGAELRFADLSEACLSSANLCGAVLVDAYLFQASLVQANLRNANLSSAYLYRASLDYAELVNANLQEAYLLEAHLRGTNLQGADLRGADLRGANLSRCNLFEANLRDAQLVGANLEGAILRNADLFGTDFGKANLSRADIVGADLRTAQFVEANLSGACLSGASFGGNNFQGADLNKADLKRGQGLDPSDVYNAVNLENAKLDDSFRELFDVYILSEADELTQIEEPNQELVEDFKHDLAEEWRVYQSSEHSAATQE